MLVCSQMKTVEISEGLSVFLCYVFQFVLYLISNFAQNLENGVVEHWYCRRLVGMC